MTGGKSGLYGARPLHYSFKYERCAGILAHAAAADGW